MATNNGSGWRAATLCRLVLAALAACLLLGGCATRRASVKAVVRDTITLRRVDTLRLYTHRASVDTVRVFDTTRVIIDSTGAVTRYIVRDRWHTARDTVRVEAASSTQERQRAAKLTSTTEQRTAAPWWQQWWALACLLVIAGVTAGFAQACVKK